MQFHDQPFSDPAGASTHSTGRRKLLFAAASIALLGAVPAWSQITNMGTPVTGADSHGYGVSADGEVVVGEVVTPGGPLAYRWTAIGGWQTLGTLNAGTESQAYGISGDGRVIVGSARDGADGNVTRAFRWTQGSGMQSLGYLSAGRTSEASAASFDGSVVVGTAELFFMVAPGQYDRPRRAFRWTQAGGMVNLGTLNGVNVEESFANGVSADGSVVVGAGTDASNGFISRAFRWTAGGGMATLGNLPGGSSSTALGVSADGDVVVGYAESGNFSRAFRWTTAGMASLGTLHAGSNSSATAANANGSVVVGESADGAAGDISRAFRWTQAGGMVSVEQWLRNQGMVVPADITYSASGVSADGDVIVGSLENGHAFIARVAPAGNGVIGSGLIDIVNYDASIAGASTAPRLALNDADLVVHGAHGNPLRAMVAVGRSNFWAAGDLGADHRNGVDSRKSTGEIGAGRRLSDAFQLQLALGRTYSQQSFELGGEARLDGTYLVPELMWKLGEQLHASVSGYFNSGRAHVRRGYLNAGVADSSSGEAHVDTTALRLRVDWLNALRLGNADLTPYTSVTRTRTRIDGYTETGGGFPARWDTRTENSSILRVGVDAVYPLTDATRLLGRLELNRRFERQGAGASGDVLGLYGFNLPGQAYRQSWLRVGAGAEAKVGDGTASVMLNTNTQGGVPAWWLAASYRVSF